MGTMIDIAGIINLGYNFEISSTVRPVIMEMASGVMLPTL